MTFDRCAHAAYNTRQIVNNVVISKHLKHFNKYIPPAHQPPTSQRMDGITWEQFLREINVILEKSREIGDNWEIVQAVNQLFLLNFFPMDVDWKGPFISSTEYRYVWNLFAQNGIR